MPNPLVITIPETTTGATVSGGISCVANAGYMQRVDVEIVDSNGTRVTGQFNGNGEGVSMTLDGKKKHLNFSDLEAPVDVKMAFSYNSGSGYQDNTAGEVVERSAFDGPTVKVFNVTTEDSTDNDDNDTYLTFVAQLHAA